MTKKQERIAFFNRAMENLGISIDDRFSLRRIEMTLHRWAELECGDGNDHGSWAIERDEDTDRPHMVHHHYRHGHGQDYTVKTPIADREKGALKRLEAIMAKYPHLKAYHQTDPRGCALHLVPIEKLGDRDISAYYSSYGVAVRY